VVGARGSSPPRPSRGTTRRAPRGYDPGAPTFPLPAEPADTRVAAPFCPHLRRIATLVPQSERAPAPKIARHGADEDKHGRVFTALMKNRGLIPVPEPPETDHTMLLGRHGIGLAHDKLRRDEPLTVRDIIVYLAGSPNSAPPTRC
jgi:hypothetical protein